MSTPDSGGRLGILLPGLGAVASTFIAGVLAARNGLAPAVGSLSEGGHADGVPLTEALDLAPLDDLVFGGWDPYPVTAHDAARRAKVIDESLLEKVADELLDIRAMPAVFDQEWVAALTDTTNVKSGTSHLDLSEQLRDDIRAFRSEQGVDRVVAVWTASTEAYRPPTAVHASLEAFEAGLAANDPAISPSQVYAHALVSEGVPVANGSPNLMFDFPAMRELADREGTPIAGRDFKTGQTLVKTALAPMLAARLLGVNGWFSTNILGNLDGLVLNEEENFRSKEVTKGGVLESILDGGAHPELWGDIDHLVRINYYPPKGDDKEGWDNIDLFGWLGYPMQLKVNFLCRDSVLAAPIVLDLARFLDLAARRGESGVIDWLGFYFKEPMTVTAGDRPIHHLFEQERILHAALAR
jgi:myo-inositol-1-phosphate synthase